MLLLPLKTFSRKRKMTDHTCRYFFFFVICINWSHGCKKKIAIICKFLICNKAVKRRVCFFPFPFLIILTKELSFLHPFIINCACCCNCLMAGQLFDMIFKFKTKTKRKKNVQKNIFLFLILDNMSAAFVVSWYKKQMITNLLSSRKTPLETFSYVGKSKWVKLSFYSNRRLLFFT